MSAVEGEITTADVVKAVAAPPVTFGGDVFAGLTLEAAQAGGYYVYNVPARRVSDGVATSVTEIVFAGDLSACLTFITSSILKHEAR